MIRLATCIALALAILVGANLVACRHRDEPAPSAEQSAAAAARLGDASEALAGCDVLFERAAPADLPIVMGVRSYVAATAGKDALPRPTWTGAAIAADPPAYQAAGEKAERAAKGTAWAFYLKTAAGVLGAVGVFLARNAFPQYATALDFGWKLLAPKLGKKEDEAAHALLAQAKAAFGAFDTLPPEERAAMQAMVERLPPKARAAFDVARSAAFNLG
jgi:hypothetical protein